MKRDGVCSNLVTYVLKAIEVFKRIVLGYKPRTAKAPAQSGSQAILVGNTLAHGVRSCKIIFLGDIARPRNLVPQTAKRLPKALVPTCHAKFGEGVVLQLEGAGVQERVQINFIQAVVKWPILAFAKLDVL